MFVGVCVCVCVCVCVWFGCGRAGLSDAIDLARVRVFRLGRTRTGMRSSNAISISSSSSWSFATGCGCDGVSFNVDYIHRLDVVILLLGKHRGRVASACAIIRFATFRVQWAASERSPVLCNLGHVFWVSDRCVRGRGVWWWPKRLVGLDGDSPQGEYGRLRVALFS